MAVYLNQYQMLPYERVSETMGDLFGCPVSAQVIQESNVAAYEQLEEVVEKQIKESVTLSPVMHNDETGIRCEGKTKWIHTYSTEESTYYSMHQKRGSKAMDDIGILPSFTGISVHDRFSAYDYYLQCGHGLCNAHLLRDLKSLQEDDNKPWAKQMQELILAAYQLSLQSGITQQAIWDIENRYDQIVAQGLGAEPPPINTGRRNKKTKSLNLLQCYRDRKKSILLFLHRYDVPFDNNLAERDLRMVKLKQKISGCFRTQQGADIFCRIRSYISTLKKQNQKVWIALKQIISIPKDPQPIPILVSRG